MPPDKGASCCCIPRYIPSCIPTHLHNLPTALTEPTAEQHTEHICTTLLKTESCQNFQIIQLSGNFQNLPSITVLMCENINIGSKKKKYSMIGLVPMHFVTRFQDFKCFARM